MRRIRLDPYYLRPQLMWAKVAWRGPLAAIFATVVAVVRCVPKPAQTGSGRLAAESIDRSVRSRLWAFQRCYEDGLKRDPMLQGRVVVQLTIGIDGRVTNVRRDPMTTLEDTVVLDCILADYKKMRFPKPEGGAVNVVYPVAFTAPGIPSRATDAALVIGSNAASAPAYSPVVVSKTAASSHRPGPIEAFANLPEYPCPPLPSVARDVGSAAAAESRADGGNGRLDPALIQERIRGTYGAMRSCYESGLTRNPELAGRVTTRFVIDRDGIVDDASPICTSLRDRATVECVVAVFRRLRFPVPEAGKVIVDYPIVFSPSD
jgi:hypothetical protein